MGTALSIAALPGALEPKRTTSSKATPDFIVTFIVGPVTVICWVSYPTYENIKTSPTTALILNFPSKSEVTPVEVFLITMDTPGKG